MAPQKTVLPMKLALPPLVPASSQPSTGSSGPLPVSGQSNKVSTQCATVLEPISQVTVRQWPPGTFQCEQDGGIVVFSCQMHEGRFECGADMCGGWGFGGSVENERQFDELFDAASSVINGDLPMNQKAFNATSSHLSSPHWNDQGGAYWTAARDVTTFFDDRYQESDVKKPKDGLIFRCALPESIKESVLDPDARNSLGSAVIPLKTMRQPYLGGKQSKYLARIKAPSPQFSIPRQTSSSKSGKQVQLCESTAQITSKKSKTGRRGTPIEDYPDRVTSTKMGNRVDLAAEIPETVQQNDRLPPFQSTAWPPCTFKGPQLDVTVAIACFQKEGKFHFQSHLSGGCSYQGMGQEARFKASVKTFDDWVEQNHTTVWNASLLSASRFCDSKIRNENRGLHAARSLKAILMEMSNSEATRLAGYHFIQVAAETIQSLVDDPPRTDNEDERGILADSTVKSLRPRSRNDQFLHVTDPNFQPPLLPWEVVWDQPDIQRPHAQNVPSLAPVNPRLDPFVQSAANSSYLPVRSVHRGKRPVSPPRDVAIEVLGSGLDLSGSGQGTVKRQRSRLRQPATDEKFALSQSTSDQIMDYPAFIASTAVDGLPPVQTQTSLSSTGPSYTGLLPLALDQSHPGNELLWDTIDRLSEHEDEYTDQASPGPGTWPWRLQPPSESGISAGLGGSHDQGGCRPAPGRLLDPNTQNSTGLSWRQELVGSQLADLFPVQDETK